MFRIIETVATAILLLLLMMFVLHVIRGDALEWLTSKFRIDAGGVDEPTSSAPNIPIPNNPLLPPISS